MKILVTGGAGYIGTTLIPMLLEQGHEVRVFDSLMFDGGVLLPFFRRSGFCFCKGDIRDQVALEEAARGCEAIMHLAAIVGFPACRKYPDLAQTTNVEGSRNVAKVAGRDRLVLFGSTGSNYGALENEICTEETPLNPLSLYGKTKTEAERILMNECPTIAYRFATAYGVSPRLRLDLLVNDFVFRALRERHLVVYESHFMRTFIHVADIARSFLFGLEHAAQMTGQVYNIGDESQNFTKRQICEKIREHIRDTYIHYAGFGKDADQRNYTVSYKKIRALGYSTRTTLEQGIQELIRALECIQVHTPYSNV